MKDDKFIKIFSLIVLTYGLSYLLILTLATIPAANMDFAKMILAFVLGPMLSGVLGFWIGSSIGSKQKSEKLAGP